MGKLTYEQFLDIVTYEHNLDIVTYEHILDIVTYEQFFDILTYEHNLGVITYEQMVFVDMLFSLLSVCSYVIMPLIVVMAKKYVLMLLCLKNMFLCYYVKILSLCYYVSCYFVSSSVTLSIQAATSSTVGFWRLSLNFLTMSPSFCCSPWAFSPAMFWMRLKPALRST